MSREKTNNFIGYDRDITYSNLKKYFEESIGKTFDERFKFLFNFKKQGKQGLVGCISTLNSMKEIYVFKLSPDFDYIPIHENIIMKDLEKIYHFCPNFCRSYGIMNFNVDTDAYEGNPFTKDGLIQEVLLMEYLQGKLLNQFLNSRKNSEKILFSLIKQILLAIMIAQEKCKFTHYDLHCNNIIIMPCDMNLVIHYKFSDKFNVAIPTYGYYPVIIDFGFAFSNEMNGTTFWNTLAHTDVGFYTDRFDKISDFKLFLITMADDLGNYKFKTTENFRKFIRNLFSNLKVDFSTGWLQSRHRGTVEVISRILNFPSFKLDIFIQSEFLCIDLLQSLIILPLEKQDYSNVLDAIKLFSKEFHKIEDILSDNITEKNRDNLASLNIYMFKEVINHARNIRSYYINRETTNDAIITFKNSVINSLYNLIKFVRISIPINYESILCSILIMGRSIEGILYDLMLIRSREKGRQERAIKYSLEELYYFIDYKFQTECIFNTESKIYGINIPSETRINISLNEKQLSMINEKDWYNRVELLGDIYTHPSPGPSIPCHDC